MQLENIITGQPMKRRNICGLFPQSENAVIEESDLTVIVFLNGCRPILTWLAATEAWSNDSLRERRPSTLKPDYETLKMI